MNNYGTPAYDGAKQQPYERNNNFGGESNNYFTPQIGTAKKPAVDYGLISNNLGQKLEESSSLGGIKQYGGGGLQNNGFSAVSSKVVPLE